MSEKKKSPILKGVEGRIDKPQGTRPTAPSAGETQAKPVSRKAAVAVAQPTVPPGQLSRFEAAMKQFHARRFREARELFIAATEGPERDVAQRAQLHLAMCDRRLEQGTVNLLSAEDHYNYGVALINTRNAGEARAHLEKALEMSPNADHIHYALALALALGGDTPRAFENLKRAIEIEPRNRALARQDADFAPLAGRPPFRELLYPEKKGW